jgi:hypothetical protein
VCVSHGKPDWHEKYNKKERRTGWRRSGMRCAAYLQDLNPGANTGPRLAGDRTAIKIIPLKIQPRAGIRKKIRVAAFNNEARATPEVSAIFQD